MRGAMLWFNPLKDLGFISTEEGERLPVRGSGFAPGERPKGRCATLPVEFDVVENEGEREATGVSFVQDSLARRARSRRSGLRG